MYKRPLLHELWEELDAVVYRLKTDGWENGPLSAEESKRWGIDIGQAQGIAYAIALTYDLTNPNIEWVREEAMRRWEEHLGNPTPIGTAVRDDLVRMGLAVYRRGNDRGDRSRVDVSPRAQRRNFAAHAHLGRVRRVAGK